MRTALERRGGGAAHLPTGAGGLICPTRNALAHLVLAVDARRLVAHALFARHAALVNLQELRLLFASAAGVVRRAGPLPLRGDLQRWVDTVEMVGAEEKWRRGERERAEGEKRGRGRGRREGGATHTGKSARAEVAKS